MGFNYKKDCAGGGVNLDWQVIGKYPQCEGCDMKEGCKDVAEHYQQMALDERKFLML